MVPAPARLVSGTCRDQVQQTRWLKKQKCVLSRFRKPEVQNQEVSRVGSFRRALREKCVQCLSPSLWQFPESLTFLGSQLHSTPLGLQSRLALFCLCLCFCSWSYKDTNQQRLYFGQHIFGGNTIKPIIPTYFSQLEIEESSLKPLLFPFLSNPPSSSDFPSETSHPALLSSCSSLQSTFCRASSSACITLLF